MGMVCAALGAHVGGRNFVLLSFQDEIAADQDLLHELESLDAWGERLLLEQLMKGKEGINANFQRAAGVGKQ